MADVTLGRTGAVGQQLFEVMKLTWGSILLGCKDRAPRMCLCWRGAGDVDLFGSARELILVKDRADRNTLGDEITLVEPAAGETLDLRKEMLLREVVLVAEARIEQVLGEVEAISEGRSRSSTCGVMVTPAPTIPSMTTDVGPMSKGVISSRLLR